MTNHNMTYDLQDLQDIVKTLETDTTVVNEITLAKNMIKSPDFNYLEMPDDAPFISSFIPTPAFFKVVVA
ncbi:hypothetical protein [Oleiphilus sp. HI0086]|uniref:hypothetical protein n=1 Tax=Oleiphilus sp. HI0086 TaxID=1822260 RepID=UPI0007C31AF4|nr:hypothetical protein [Oleiphilus sp. HI0086]KZZ35023.1 hypothetical protein A3756_16655 [Oleiphilus sp. HI0086]